MSWTDKPVVVCSDGKVHDAFLMCYKSDTQAGLNELDLKSLKSVLEERFGYSLCLFDRDILPGKGIYLPCVLNLMYIKNPNSNCLI